jgi:hypothetical protein
MSLLIEVFRYILVGQKKIRNSKKISGQPDQVLPKHSAKKYRANRYVSIVGN